jgi:hypothetical protein
LVDFRKFGIMGVTHSMEEGQAREDDGHFSGFHNQKVGFNEKKM